MINQNIYVCPKTGGKLKLVVEEGWEGIIKKGFFQNRDGYKYFIQNGIPNFTYPKTLKKTQQEQYEYYEANAAQYDDLQGLTFALQNEDEAAVRSAMVGYLRLNKDAKVLELACGTGRDSENIASLLDENGMLFVQDLSGAMLNQCKKKLHKFSVPINYSIGNASYLAFPDNYFDAAYSFGGLNVCADIKRALKEMVRVVKPGGRIVVGDESLPVWLYDTEFGKTLINANPLFKFKVPFNSIPVEAREVTVRWIIGGVYYLISFTVGGGEPVGNFDIEIPGKRGGTLKTRYYGKLEGVTPETKELVSRAAEKSKKSLHKWLEDELKIAAKKQLSKNRGSGV